MTSRLDSLTELGSSAAAEIPISNKIPGRWRHLEIAGPQSAARDEELRHTSRVSAAKIRARFMEPMLLLRTDRLADDPSRYQYEVKWDGFRAIALKRGGSVHLRSRNDKDFNGKYLNDRASARRHAR